jgi:hypothetical protein
LFRTAQRMFFCVLGEILRGNSASLGRLGLGLCMRSAASRGDRKVSSSCAAAGRRASPRSESTPNGRKAGTAGGRGVYLKPLRVVSEITGSTRYPPKTEIPTQTPSSGPMRRSAPASGPLRSRERSANTPAGTARRRENNE